MTLTGSGQISILDIRDEFGDIGSFSLVQAGAKALNNCSSGGDAVAPYVLTNWYGYNDNASPGSASNLTARPGSSDGNANQDTHISVGWDPLTCAVDYELYTASVVSGPYVKAVTGITSLNYLYPVWTNETIVYFKITGVSDTSVEGPLSTALTGKTAPRQPQSLNGSILDCTSPATVNVSWNNGTSPGVRQSVTAWRWNKNGGSWSAWQFSTTGSTSDSVSSGVGWVNGDTLNTQAYYFEEGVGSFVADTTNVICPD